MPRRTLGRVARHWARLWPSSTIQVKLLTRVLVQNGKQHQQSERQPWDASAQAWWDSQIGERVAEQQAERRGLRRDPGTCVLSTRT